MFVIIVALFCLQCVHVDGLKNRLEALSSPQLVSAFNTMDIAKSKFFVKIFADMDRSPELVKYYRKCARAKLLKVWIQIVDQAELEMVEETALHWTYKFFDAVIKHVQEQVINNNFTYSMITRIDYTQVYFKFVFYSQILMPDERQIQYNIIYARFETMMVVWLTKCSRRFYLFYLIYQMLKNCQVQNNNNKS